MKVSINFPDFAAVVVNSTCNQRAFVEKFEFERVLDGKVIMFSISELKTLIKVDPRTFGQQEIKLIEEEIERIVCNKVVHSLGLVICIFNILKVGSSFLIPGEGSYLTPVYFEVIVFRPFVNEILTGTVSASGATGIKVSIGFFDEIHITPECMQQPSKYHPESSKWSWVYENSVTSTDGEENSNSETTLIPSNNESNVHNLFISIGDKIRFRVVDDIFYDVTPVPDALASCDLDKSNLMKDPTRESTQIFRLQSNSSELDSKSDQSYPPYVIFGSICEPGLGVISWWS